MTSTEITKANITPLQAVSDTFLKVGDKFEDALPAHVSMKRFRQVALTAISQSRDLAEVATTKAGRQSILTSCLQCASDGLIPDGREAAMVAFKQKQPDGQYIKLAQYMPMVRGIINRMQQTGGAKDISVNLVYRNEEFHYAETKAGTEFRHTPILLGDKGDLVGAYALTRTLDGGFYIAVLDIDELAKIEKSSKAKFGPWKGDFKSEMQKKSALKRLAKIAPVSAEVASMIQRDNETFHTLEAPEPSKPTILAQLQEKKQPAEPEADEATNTPDQPEVEDASFTETSPPKSDPLPTLPKIDIATATKQDLIMWAGIFNQHLEAAEGLDAGILWTDNGEIINHLKDNEPKAYDLLAQIMDSKG